MASSLWIWRGGLSSKWRSSMTMLTHFQQLNVGPALTSIHNENNSGISKVSCRMAHTGHRGSHAYSDILSYIGGLSESELEKKQLIDKFVNICTTDGKRTKARAITYQTLHHLAKAEGATKLLDQAIENVKPICEVDKVRVAGTTYHVPDFVPRDRQRTLAIRWIREAACKRRTNKNIGLDQCLSAEIMDAYRKKGSARKKRDDVHELASNNRSYVHFRWR